MTDYYQLFGVEQPAAGEPGAKEPEVAAPAGGENEPEIAEPVTEEPIGGDLPTEKFLANGEIEEETDQAEDNVEADGTGQDIKLPDEDKQAKTQSKEERARNAARRREREKQQLRENLRREWEAEKEAESKATEDSIIAGLGIINSFTGQRIVSRADFDAYQQQMADERKSKLDKELRKSGMSRETLDELVSASPVLQQAVSEVEAVKNQLQREKATVRSQQQLSDELSKITKLDPTIKTLDDLRNKPYISQMTEMIRKGYQLSDAYRLATEDLRQQQAIANIKQAAINSIGSKEHHQPVAVPAGQALVSVPQDVARYYKIFNPGATPEEIKKHYNANLKR